MKKLKYIIGILVVSIVSVLAPISEVRADNLWPQGPEVSSLSAVVMEVDSGTIVYDKQGTDSHFPASITKVMTALVALENSKLDEVVTFSYDAVHNLEPGSSHIARDENENMTMEQCLYGLLLESANECANAIAEYVAGSVPAFAEMMNQKAAELGCVNTHFANPHGLHDDNHYTCAYDMALIARAAYENPTFALMTGTKTYTIPPTNKHAEPTFLNNHHNMLHVFTTAKYLYEYCVGGKTGYTSKALSTLVTYARKDGVTLLCVTMCGEGNSHYVDTTNLFNYYFDNMQLLKSDNISQNIEEISQKGISLLSAGDVPFTLDTESAIYVPKNLDYSNLMYSYKPSHINENPKEVGRFEFMYDNRPVGSIGLNGAVIDQYPFKNLYTDEGSDSYIKINPLIILMVIVGVVAGVIIIRLAFMHTSQAISTARRRKFERRDPHKNLRLIKRKRRRRRRRR